MASSTEIAPFYTITDNLTDDYYYYDTFTTSPISVKQEVLSMSHLYLPILYYIMFFVGFTGNLFVIIVIGSRRKKSARLVDTFVVNLALADLIFVFTLPLWAVSSGQRNQWPFGNLLCKMSSYIIAVNRYSNIFFLTCMSVDRYLAVVRLMDSHLLRRSKCMHLTCGVVWGVSLVLGIPSLIYRRTLSDNQTLFCLDDLESSFFLSTILLSVFLTFVVPVLIIVLCYGSMLLKLRRHCIAAGNPRTEARRRHSTKIVFTIIIAFLVSWLPYNIFKTIQVTVKISDAQLSHYTEISLAKGIIISSCLAFVNSCLNPIIYLLLDKHFRHSAAAVCQSCLCQEDTQQSYMSSNSTFSNATDSVGSITSRGRLFSLTLKSQTPN